jgi:cytochrome c-type biogenesis protein CcmH
MIEQFPASSNQPLGLSGWKIASNFDRLSSRHDRSYFSKAAPWVGRNLTIFTPLIVILCALGLFALTASPVAAQQPTPSDDEVNRLAKEMYCPVCENVPLDVCPTQACAQWRALIRQKMAEGLSDAEIKEYFVIQYGDRVLAEPPRRGLNWLVYILPPVFFIGGAVIVYNVMRSMRKTAVEADPIEPDQILSEEDAYLARMEEELRHRQEKDG